MRALWLLLVLSGCGGLGVTLAPEASGLVVIERSEWTVCDTRIVVEVLATPDAAVIAGCVTVGAAPRACLKWTREQPAAPTSATPRPPPSPPVERTRTGAGRWWPRAI